DVCCDTSHIRTAPARCRIASSFSEAKKRSAMMPRKNGETSAAIAVAPYASPICAPEKPRVCPRYVPIVTNHDPQMKYWRNIITESFMRTLITSPQHTREDHEDVKA